MFSIFIHFQILCRNARFLYRLNLTSFRAKVSLQSGKVAINRIEILAVATIWDVLLDVFCSCVRDFYSPCPYCRYIGYMFSVFGF